MPPGGLVRQTSHDGPGSYMIQGKELTRRPSREDRQVLPPRDLARRPSREEMRGPVRDASDTHLYDDYTYAPTNISVLSFGLSEFDDIDPYSTKVFLSFLHPL